MKDYMKILSENILSLRKKLGMTQESLGEKLGISFQAVSKWENGLLMSRRSDAARTRRYFRGQYGHAFRKKRRYKQRKYVFVGRRSRHGLPRGIPWR